MSILILEACKKRKRRNKLYEFHSFCDLGCPIRTTGPFRDNIRIFPQQGSEIADYNHLGMPIWCMLLAIPLYTTEETVEHSCLPHCDHCQLAGWSNHLITKRKYHMLIPTDNAWNKILYKLIHGNGFGHFFRINGIEGGSKYLYGRELMDLRHGLCTILQSRKITVADISKKRSMDIGLLHEVAYGYPWFGRWGYSFCHGSFGITEHKYNRALEILSLLELESIVRDFSDTDQCQEIKQIIRLYRDMSETQFITLQDVLKFMVIVKSRAGPQKKPLLLPNPASLVTSSRSSTWTNLLNKPLLKDKPAKYKTFSTMVCRWLERRLEFATEKHSSNGGRTWQDVRDAARLHIGLLEYVLEDEIICRLVNLATWILEYTIHEIEQEVCIRDEAEELLKFIIRFVPGLGELESCEISKKIELPPGDHISLLFLQSTLLQSA
ncbi:hypothetical protein UlMin_032715 [Ulmus minor]